jgi:hypothetical protein
MVAMYEFLLNCTPVQVKDKEFENGFDVGYMHCKVDFLGKNVPITDDLLYTIIAQTAIDVRHTSRHNTGYLAGFFYALLEKEPKRPRFQIVGKISSVEVQA